MNLVEIDRALRKLRLSGMADVLETRLRHAQTERLPPLDLVATLVTDELQRREDRLLARRHKLAGFRDADRSLDTFDFDFNKKMNRVLIYELATARFIQQREELARAISRKPSGAPRSNRAIASSIVKPICSSSRSQRPPSTARGKCCSPIWRPCRS
jgi:hypothetical protein